MSAVGAATMPVPVRFSVVATARAGGVQGVGSSRMVRSGCGPWQLRTAMGGLSCAGGVRGRRRGGENVLVDGSPPSGVGVRGGRARSGGRGVGRGSNKTWPGRTVCAAAAAAAAGGAEGGGGDGDGLGESFAEIAKFALPALGIVMVNPLMTVIDNAFVGQVSSTQVAAMGPGGALLDFPSFLFFFLSVATTNLIATKVAEDVPVDQAAREVLGVTLRLGVLSGTFLFLAVNAFKVLGLQGMGASAETLGPAVAYVSIRSLWYPLTHIVSSMQSSLMASRDSLSPLKAVCAAGVINCIGDFVMCGVLGQGIAGAAWATLASQLVLGTMILGFVRSKGFFPTDLFTLKGLPAWPDFAKVLRFGPPLMGSVSLRIAGYVMLLRGASALGTQALAAHQILVGLFLFFALLGDPLNQTAQTMLPKYLMGARRSPAKARALIAKLVGTAIALGLTTGLLVVGICNGMHGLFTKDPVVAAHMASVNLPMIAVLMSSPASICMDAVLICTKDFKFLLAGSTMSLLFLGGSLPVFLKAGLGIKGVWWALALSFCGRFMVSFTRCLTTKHLKDDPNPAIAVAA